MKAGCSVRQWTMYTNTRTFPPSAHCRTVMRVTHLPLTARSAGPSCPYKRRPPQSHGAAVPLASELLSACCTPPGNTATTATRTKHRRQQEGEMAQYACALPGPGLGMGWAWPWRGGSQEGIRAGEGRGRDVRCACRLPCILIPPSYILPRTSLLTSEPAGSVCCVTVT